MSQTYDIFKGSEVPGSLGVELEAIFVHRDTMMPIGRAGDALTSTDIINWINNRGIVDADHEWRKDTVEVKTKGFWANAKAAKVGLFYLYDELLQAAEYFGLMVLPIAQFDDALRADICDLPAYQRLRRRSPSVRDGANFFGMHVHYGIQQLDEDTFRAMRCLNTVSGFLTALTANSFCPRTLVCSKRMICFKQVTGVSFYNFQNVEEYEKFMNDRLNEGAIEQRSRLWAINRLGKYTLEARGTDLPGLVREAWVVAGLHAAVFSLFLEGKMVYELGHFLCARNMELAAGHGLSDLSEEFWDPFEGGKLTPLRTIFNRMEYFVGERMVELGWGDEFEYFKRMVEERNNGAERTRRWRAEGRDEKKEANSLLVNEVKELRPLVEEWGKEVRKNK